MLWLSSYIVAGCVAGVVGIRLGREREGTCPSLLLPSLLNPSTLGLNTPVTLAFTLSSFCFPHKYLLRTCSVQASCLVLFSGSRSTIQISLFALLNPGWGAGCPGARRAQKLGLVRPGAWGGPAVDVSAKDVGSVARKGLTPALLPAVWPQAGPRASVLFSVKWVVIGPASWDRCGMKLVDAHES